MSKTAKETNVRELTFRYRPKKFKDMIGQKDAVSILRGFVKKRSIPHVLLFTGPSGVGKTTAAYIMREQLNCVGRDFTELNCASDARGIDTVREINQYMGMKAMAGESRIWLLDECHQLTSTSQEGLLKILEDPPEHVYFILCSTDPRKLKRTIVTRCTNVKFNPLSDDDLQKLIEKIIDKEHLNVGEDVVEAILRASDGSARQALVFLNIVAQLKNEEDQLDAIREGFDEATVIDLYRALLKGEVWAKVADVLKTIDGNPESIRRQLLRCCGSSLLKGGQIKYLKRVRFIAEHFVDNFYDSDKDGLTLACFDIVHARSK